MASAPTTSNRTALPPLWVRILFRVAGGFANGRGGGGEEGVWTKKTGGVWALTRPGGNASIVRYARDFWRPGAENNHGGRLRNHAAWTARLNRLAIPTPDLFRATFYSIGPAGMGVVEEALLSGAPLLRKNPAHSRSAASLLARLHTCDPTSEGVAGPGLSAPTWVGRAYPPGPKGAVAWWRASWGRRIALALEELAPPRRGGTEAEAEIERRAKAIAAEIERRVRERLTGSPRWTLVHGDIQPENLRHDATETLRFIDLEWMHIGLAEIDLAHAERRLCFLDSGEPAERFFAAYREAGGGECLDRYRATKGTWLALHDLRRAGSVERKIRRGRGLKANQTTEEWLERAEAALDLPRGGKP